MAAPDAVGGQTNDAMKLPMSSETRCRVSTCGQSRGTAAACPPCKNAFLQSFFSCCRERERVRRLLCCSWVFPALGAC